MPQAIAWSFSAGGPSGAGASASGSTEGDGIISVSKTFDGGGSETDLALQVDRVANVTMLAISSDVLDGTVTVKGSGAKKKLTGPIVLFGEAVTLFASDLSTIKVHNTSQDKPATVQVLIGMTVA